MALNEYTLRGVETSVVITAEASRLLLQSGNGDAALCYIALASGKGLGALNLSRQRIDAALTALMDMGLAAKRGEAPAPAPAPLPTERTSPEYTNADLARALEGAEFRNLAAAVDTALGKRLTTPDQKLLLGLYDDLGFSADVIFLLVNFCIERSVARYGPGRKPTMRQIEREGYLWAKMELMDQDRASQYIRKVNRQREALPRMMKLLGLGERKLSASEEKYLGAWSDMGFDDAVIELAYDKTVLKCKELKWPYMNSILTSWNDKGLKTLAAVEEGDRPVQSRSAAESDGPGREDLLRMEKLLEKMKNDGKGEM